ncbi:hypothetical protein DEM34_19310, partial [Spiribacter halobius]
MKSARRASSSPKTLRCGCKAPPLRAHRTRAPSRSRCSIRNAAGGAGRWRRWSHTASTTASYSAAVAQRPFGLRSAP